jgi:uncharacterized protein
MAKRNDYRLVIDPNIYLSYLIGKQLKALELIIEDSDVVLILAEKLVIEFKLKINHPKFKKYFDHKTALAFVDFLVERSIHVNIQSDVTICRDAKDNYLLALAKDANAHFLITGDEDLLVLSTFGNTQIIRFKDFMNNHFSKL